MRHLADFLKSGLLAAIALAAFCAAAAAQDASDAPDPTLDDWICLPADDGRSWRCGKRDNPPERRSIDPGTLPDDEPAEVSTLPDADVTVRARPGSPLLLGTLQDQTTATDRERGVQQAPIAGGYALLLATVATVADLIDFVEDFEVDRGQAARLPSLENGVLRHLLLYGRYDTPRAATSAIEELPPVLRTMRPQVLILADYPASPRAVDPDGPMARYDEPTATPVPPTDADVEVIALADGPAVASSRLSDTRLASEAARVEPTPLVVADARDPATPAESTPAESTPAESTPAESTPAESTPVESTPAESTPAESTPVESTPVESTPVESTPVESTPVESTPVESTPVESTPVESTPVESTPVESTPVESTPVESTPVESTPVESTPVASTPVASTPVASTPVASTPVASTPVASTPVASTPVASTPVASNPRQPISESASRASENQRTASTASALPRNPLLPPADRQTAQAATFPRLPVGRRGAFDRLSGRYTIQLATLADEQTAINWLQDQPRLDRKRTFAIASSGRLLIVFGRFASFTDAKAQLDQLTYVPGTPWIRRAELPEN